MSLQSYPAPSTPTMTIPLHTPYTLQPWPTAWPASGHHRFIALASDHDVAKNLSPHFPHPYTMADAEAWVALQTGVDPPKRFAICDPQGPIGSIGLTIRHRGQTNPGQTAEIGYWLGKPFWGRGIMTAALQVMTTYAFETLALTRIEAQVRTHNSASIRVLEKLGYKLETPSRQPALKQDAPEAILLYAIRRDDS